MTWNEAIDKIADLKLGYASFEDLARCFHETEGFWAKDHDEFDRRFKKRWVVSWICTDTEVGLALYSLDGEVVAASSQSARKEEEEIRFTSMEAAGKVLAALKSLGETFGLTRPFLIDLGEEIDPSWFEKNPRSK